MKSRNLQNLSKDKDARGGGGAQRAGLLQRRADVHMWKMQSHGLSGPKKLEFKLRFDYILTELLGRSFHFSFKGQMRG